MDWSLYRCGRIGHITYRARRAAPARAHARRDRLRRTVAVPAVRHLRAGEPHGTGPAADAPAIRRGKEIRGDLILKLFAIERAIRFVIFGAVAFGIWRFANSRLDRSGDQQGHPDRQGLRQGTRVHPEPRAAGEDPEPAARQLVEPAPARVRRHGPRDRLGHRGVRALAGQALGRVLRHDRDLARPPLRDLRAHPRPSRSPRSSCSC